MVEAHEEYLFGVDDIQEDEFELSKSVPIEMEVALDKLSLRPYQQAIWNAFFVDRFDRMVICLPRRGGKDIITWNITIYCAIMERVGLYYYIFPTYSQGRKAIWDSTTNDGERFIDFIPNDLIKSINTQELKITLKNGSKIQVIGSDNPDRIMGTNPVGVVFSEYAMQDPRIFTLITPILNNNGGWAIFNSTPRGKNSFWELLNLAKTSKQWWSCHLTLNDTKHVSVDKIEEDINNSVITRDMVQQEYYTSFDLGVVGSYYAKYLDRMRLNQRIGDIPWLSDYPVYTACDIGVADPTCIIFFQVIGSNVRVIDFHQDTRSSLEDFIAVLHTKPYLYGGHYAPFDIKVQEWGLGMTRYEKARQLGVEFEVAPPPARISQMDGIEAVKTLFSRMSIDEIKCEELLKSLENYRKEFVEKTGTYKLKPIHDKWSHACFTGDMSLKTKFGEIFLKDAKPGMEVVTPLGLRKILKVHKRKTDELCEIKVSNKTIGCTRDHELFTQRGLVYADGLRYTDVLEKHSIIKGYLWKKLFTYFTGEQGLSGFKNTILSLRTNHKSCLMDTFIHGMDRTTVEESASASMEADMDFQAYTDISGHTTMVKSRKGWLSTMLIVIPKTIKLRILKRLMRGSILVTMQENQTVGLNQKHVKKGLGHKTQKLPNGIEAPLGWNGIRNKEKDLKEKNLSQNTKQSALHAKKSFLRYKHGENIVHKDVNIDKERMMSKVLKAGFVVFAGLLSFVVNIFPRKHAVKSVQTYRLSTPKEVYDLTIEKDNCYYIEGYLVSNCDAARVMALCVPKTAQQITPDELEQQRNRAIYGKEFGLNSPFQQPY